MRKRCSWHFCAKTSLWAFLFAAFMQNKMSKTVWKNSSSLSYGFFLPITSESMLVLKANHQLQTGATPPKHKRFPSDKNWEIAWSIRSPTMHTMSVAAVWRQSYASLMLMSFSCPESVIDLWVRFTHVAAERHKNHFLIWRLILFLRSVCSFCLPQCWLNGE